MAGYYSITLVISASVNHSVGTSMCPYFHFRKITSKYQWIFTKLGMCIDIVQILFGIANGHFHQFLTNLSVCKMSVYSFLDDNLRKYQLIYLAATHLILFQDNKLSKYQWIFTKLDMCIDIVEILFLILMGKFHQFLTVICPRQDNGEVLSFHIFIYIFFAQKLQLNSIILQTIKYQ